MDREECAHPWGSCPVVFIQFSPDGRLPHTLSLIRLAARDERYSGVGEGCALSTPGPAEEEHAGSTLPSGEGTGCEKGSKASATKRDCSSTSRASMPSRIPGNSAVSYGRFRWQTGRSRSQWGSRPPRPLVVQALQCWELQRLRARQAAPASLEARTLLRAGAGTSRIRIRFLVNAVRAVPPKGDMPPCQPLELAEGLAKLATVLDKPRNSRSFKEDQGSSDWAVMPKCSAFYAPVTSTLE